MPNIKSAKKRVKVIDKKTERNRIIKSSMRTQLKKFNSAVQANNAEEASALFAATVGCVDSARAKGVIHANKANRLKAQLANRLNSIAK